jgi:DNA polymerase elongation subunit (family B)
MKFYTDVKQYGNRMMVRAVEDGKRVKYEVDYSPYLFVKSRTGKGEYRSVYGDAAEKMEFATIREAKEFTQKYSGVTGFDFYGMTQFVYPFINDRWPGEVQYDRDHINVVSLDIETMSDDGFPDIATANKALTVITISDGKKFVVVGDGDYKVHRPDVTYYKCSTEKELIGRFIEEYRKMDPDILTGWNIEFFDIPYLINRIKVVMGEAWIKMLSPWNIVREGTQRQNGVETQTFDIAGVAIMDYLIVYKKWTFTQQESYKLDHIANVELGQGKLDYSEYGSLHDLYVNNFQKYVEYNILDTDIINRLDEKLKLIDLMLALSYDAKLNYSDSLTSVRMWDVIIHNYLMKDNIVIPQFPKSKGNYSIAGGYVKEPIVGRHDWVCSFDLNSLYPHLIMQYNISPEKYMGKIGFDGCSVDGVLNGSFNDQDVRDYMQKHNATITPNGCVWNRDSQGFLSQLMEKMYVDRSKFKKMMLAEKQKYEDTGNPDNKKQSVQYDMIQMAKKIQLNSAYGALGNEWFRWFNPDYAESITLGGQLSIRWIEAKMNKFLNAKLKTDKHDYIVASDTDSIYVRLDKIITGVFGDNADIQQAVSYLDKLCSKVIEPYIDESYEELAVYVNAFDQKMRMKREAIANKGIWTGKKHYMLNVFNNEGVQYNEPQLKMMGIEAVKSSTPAACRESIKESIKIIMNRTEEELVEYVADFRERFNNMRFDEVAKPSGVNGMNKYKDASSGWAKGTPIHVRGALIYNHMVDKHSLGKKLEKIRDGDKVKFCYLKVPNPTKENVFAIPVGKLPEEFFLDKYIDYDTQFDKVFAKALRSITEVIGWKLEESSTLEGFFG